MQKLTRDYAPIFFKLGKGIKGINLETLCFNIMNLRFQKRANLHKDFEKCRDFKKLFVVVEEVEKVGLLIDEGTKEYQFAVKICQSLNDF